MRGWHWIEPDLAELEKELPWGALADLEHYMQRRDEFKQWLADNGQPE